MEIAENGADFEGVVDILDGVIRVGGGDACDGPPVFSLVVDDVVLSGFAWNYFRQLPDTFRIVMLFSEPLMGMLRHKMHVLHQFHRIGEDGFIDALDDDLMFIEDGTEDSDVRVIDVAAAERFDADKIAFNIELLGDDC